MPRSFILLLCLLTASAANASPIATWQAWEQHGGELALEQTRACLGSDWNDADQCIGAAADACTAVAQSSVAGYDGALGVCYDAGLKAWRDILIEQDRALRLAILAQQDLADRSAVLAEHDKSQLEWDHWMKLDEASTADSLAGGTLRHSYPLRVQMELTARRAIELQALSSTLST